MASLSYQDLQRACRVTELELTAAAQYGGCAGYTVERVLKINGVRVIIYPNSKIDLLTIDDTEWARATAAIIRERHGDLILGHVTPFEATS
jgi:hypothetical protein